MGEVRPGHGLQVLPLVAQQAAEVVVDRQPALFRGGDADPRQGQLEPGAEAGVGLPLGRCLQPLGDLLPQLMGGCLQLHRHGIDVPAQLGELVRALHADPVPQVALGDASHAPVQRGQATPDHAHDHRGGHQGGDGHQE